MRSRSVTPATQPEGSGTAERPLRFRGSREEFAAIVEPLRRELLVHCYRMVGSFHDAEDLVQETLLRAWRHRHTFEGRAPVRAWLYRIATNSALDLLRRRPSRTLPERVLPAGDPAGPPAPPSTEPLWLEPFPDDLLAAPSEQPESRYDARESITLAFLAALQALTPRQRAIVILRDILGFRAREAAEILRLSLPTVNSLLHRARARLAARYRRPHRARRPGGSRAGGDGPEHARLLKLYVKAWETGDVKGLISLLRRDATVSMPPSPAWFRGRAAIAQLAAGQMFGPRQRWKLRATRVNGAPGFLLYLRAGASLRPAGVQVLELRSRRVAGITTFLIADLVERFRSRRRA